MSILSAASGASVWRGYEYYTKKKVLSFTQISEDEYEGKVSGNASEPYHVKINVAHVRRSQCNCPHAKGTRIICKHMVSLYFAVFPQEADEYIAQVEAYEREEEKRAKARYAEIESHVKSLSKKELQEELFRVLLELDERNDWYW